MFIDRGPRTHGIYDRGLIEECGQMRAVRNGPRSSVSPRS